MDKLTHVTKDDLVLFMDRELDKAATFSAEQHLLHCVECSQRLQGLQEGSAAYERYHETVLEADLKVPAIAWTRLSDRVQQPGQRMGWWLWWGAAAFAGTLALFGSTSPCAAN